MASQFARWLAFCFMSFLSEIAEDCKEAEADLGAQTLTWQGFVYPCAPSLVEKGATVVIGGREVEITFAVRVRYSGTTSAGSAWEFTTLPKHGQTVTYNSTTYRIARVSNAHSTFLEIELMDINR